MKKLMSIEQVAGTFSDDLPDWQYQINLAWLRSLHSLMANGGVWASPALGTIYRKRGDGFIRELDDDSAT